jgi:drug/metabolite transporter (DMT)-like permease
MKALHTLLAPVFVLVWSSGYVVGSLATQVIAPLTVTLWRFAVAALVLAGIAVLRHEHWPDRREALRLVGVGIPMFAVQFGALYTAMSDGLPAGTTSLIACSSPLVVAAIAATAGWERLGGWQWFGIGLGVLGVLVTLADRVGRPPNVACLLWGLLGLAGLAIGSALQSRVRPHAGPAAVAAVEVAAGFAVLAVWAPTQGGLGIPVTAEALLTFSWLSLIAGVGAPLLLFALIRQRGATRATILLFPVPAVTAFAAWPLLGIPVGVFTLTGLAIVAVSLVLTTRRASHADAASDREPPTRQREPVGPRS